MSKLIARYPKDHKSNEGAETGQRTGRSSRILNPFYRLRKRKGLSEEANATAALL